jgi:hypothetical protein
LIDRDGWGQTLNHVYIWFVHLSKKLTGVCRQTLYISTLTLGVNGVESQRAFATARQACENNELVAREFQADIF